MPGIGDALEKEGRAGYLPGGTEFNQMIGGADREAVGAEGVEPQHEGVERGRVVAVTPVGQFEQPQAFGAAARLYEQLTADEVGVVGDGLRQVPLCGAVDGVLRIGGQVLRRVFKGTEPVFGKGAAAVVAGQRGRACGIRAHAGDEILARQRGDGFQSGQHAVIGLGRAGGELLPECAGRVDVTLGMAGAAQPVGGGVGLRIGVVAAQTGEVVGSLSVAPVGECADAGDGERIGGLRAVGEGVREAKQVGDGLVEWVGGDVDMVRGADIKVGVGFDC